MSFFVGKLKLTLQVIVTAVKFVFNKACPINCQLTAYSEFHPFENHGAETVMYLQWD